MGNITRKGLDIVMMLEDIEKTHPRFESESFGNYRLKDWTLSVDNGYKCEGEYSFEDDDVVREVKYLLTKDTNVWAIMSKDGYKWTLYSFSNATKSKQIPKIRKTLESKSGCFIATAVYGDENAREVVLLRTFRDNILLHSRIGRYLVSVYYLISPPLARSIKSNVALRCLVRRILLQPILGLIVRRKT